MDLGHSHDQLRDDRNLVSDAAALLELRDFDLFRAAWRSWHGNDPDERHLEAAFVHFLFHDRAPAYVRHYARRACQDAAAERLDPRRLGAHHYPRRERLPDLRDGFAATAMGGLLLVLLTLL